jgi:hypothetical protein
MFVGRANTKLSCCGRIEHRSSSSANKRGTIG